MEYKLRKTEISIEPIIPQNLFAIPNKVMSMEQIFQDINKMLETTYTMRLSQLLKITLDFNKYMWHKLKPKKPNINTKVILEPSVATMTETPSKIDTATIEVDNQMAIIQVQVGKNTIEDVLLNGATSVNIITKTLKKKRFTQTKTSPIPPQNGRSKYD